MANEFVQTMADARVDARSLSEFISKDANFMVARRLAPSVHTLDYYTEELQSSIDGINERVDNVLGDAGFNIIGTFEGGATLTKSSESLRYEADGWVYKWSGDFPKVVAPMSSPASSGGVSETAWQAVSVSLSEMPSEKVTYNKVNSKVALDSVRLKNKVNLGIPTPQAAFVFDALNKTTLEPITALFSARGFSAGIAAPVLSINGIAPQSNATGSPYTDIATLKKYQDAGHEIINHGLTPEGPKTVLSAADADSDANYSYELLRRAGIKVTGFVAYGGNFNAANIDYYSDRHPVVYANNVAPDERDLSLCTYGDDADVALTVTRASMEAVILANGTTTTDPIEILRVCKLVVDYCAANTRSVVFYHHAITGGGLNDVQIAELVDYCTANGVDVVSTSKLWQSVSNVTTHEVRLAALEKDIKRNFGLVDENLIDRENLTYWTKTLLSGAAPTETLKTTPWADSVSYTFPADNTGTAQRWALHINNVGLEKIGHGGSLCFGFDYKCDLPARNDNGTLTVKARWRSVANGGGNVQPPEHIETFSTIDIYTRRAYVVFSNQGVSDLFSKHIELVVEFTPVNGRPVTLTISNPTLNRGIIPAPYKKPTEGLLYPVSVGSNLRKDTGDIIHTATGNSLQPQNIANIKKVMLSCLSSLGQIVGLKIVDMTANEVLHTIPCSSGAGIQNLVVGVKNTGLRVVSNEGTEMGYRLDGVTYMYATL